ncbi:hypothetical protein Ntsu_54820 [Nocardia sp. IFM 10818]
MRRFGFHLLDLAIGHEAELRHDTGAYLAELLIAVGAHRGHIESVTAFEAIAFAADSILEFLELTLRQFVQPPRGPDLSARHDLIAGRIVEDGLTEIPRQLQLAADIPFAVRGSQIDRVHREAVLRQDVLVREIADELSVLDGPQGLLQTPRQRVLLGGGSLLDQIPESRHVIADVLLGDGEQLAQPAYPRIVVDTDCRGDIHRQYGPQGFPDSERYRCQEIPDLRGGRVRIAGPGLEERTRVSPDEPVALESMPEVRGQRDRMRMPAPDPLIVDGNPRDTHLARDHRFRLLELRQIVRAALGIGEHQRGGCRAAARPTGALDVVRGLRRHISQHHRLQIADIDAELEGCRARQHVHLAGDESALDIGGLRGLPLRGVLLRGQWRGDQRPVHRAIVIRVPLHRGQDELGQRSVARALGAQVPNVVGSQPTTSRALVPGAVVVARIRSCS